MNRFYPLASRDLPLRPFQSTLLLLDPPEFFYLKSNTFSKKVKSGEEKLSFNTALRWEEQPDLHDKAIKQILLQNQTKQKYLKKTFYYPGAFSW